MLYFEHKLKKQGCDLIIGIDEAGRGPLAGPVVAAAVSLSTQRFKSRIDDSKKLSPAQREKAFKEIIANSVFGIGIVNEKIIDSVNIYCATGLAMEQAVSSLMRKLKNEKDRKSHLLIDGNMKLNLGLPFTCIIKGDSRSQSIACASILAKVTRDRIMDLYDRVFPQYGFIRHKGYGTYAHMAALRNFGPSIIHRRSFAPCL